MIWQSWPALSLASAFDLRPNPSRAPKPIDFLALRGRQADVVGHAGLLIGGNWRAALAGRVGGCHLPSHTRAACSGESHSPALINRLSPTPEVRLLTSE